MQPIKVWKHSDGRRIEVYADHKVRYSGKPHTRSMTKAGDSGDQWPVLYRRDVPNLTDDEWQAAPVEEGWHDAAER